MTFKKLFRPTNKKVRLGVGLLLAGFFCVQCTRTEAFRQSEFITAISGQVVGENSPEVLDDVVSMAKRDHIKLLEYCLDNYQGQYIDYSCTLIKQERLNGNLGKEQWIDVKFLDEPYSVSLNFTKNAPIGERVLYVEGKNDNQMLVKPKGFLFTLVGTVKRQPDGPQAMRNTLRPVNMFGFARGLASLIKVYRQAEDEGDLKTSFGGFAEVAGRKTVVLIRHLPPKNDYPAARTLVYVDLEYLLPICIEGYNWDEELSCRYLYKDVKFNVGLSDEDFLPETNDMVHKK